MTEGLTPKEQDYEQAVADLQPRFNDLLLSDADLRKQVADICGFYDIYNVWHLNYDKANKILNLCEPLIRAKVEREMEEHLYIHALNVRNLERAKTLREVGEWLSQHYLNDIDWRSKMLFLIDNLRQGKM